MSPRNEDDRDAVDRAFADLIAGYHLTSDRPDPLAPREPSQDGAGRPDPHARSAPTTTRTSDPNAGDLSGGIGAARPDAGREGSELKEPGRGEPDLGEPGPGGSSVGEPGPSWQLGERAPRDGDGADVPLFRFEQPEDVEPEPEPVPERFVPEPLLPLPRPAWPVLVAWIAMGYALLAVLAAAMGLPLPRWAAWIAAIGFLAGFALLVTRLPRNRPPDAGDGAVL